MDDLLALVDLALPAPDAIPAVVRPRQAALHDAEDLVPEDPQLAELVALARPAAPQAQGRHRQRSWELMAYARSVKKSRKAETEKQAAVKEKRKAEVRLQLVVHAAGLGRRGLCSRTALNETEMAISTCLLACAPVVRGDKYKPHLAQKRATQRFAAVASDIQKKYLRELMKVSVPEENAMAGGILVYKHEWDETTQYLRHKRCRLPQHHGQ